MKHVDSKSSGVNTSNGMAVGGYDILNAGNPAGSYKRLISTIEVVSGQVQVDIGIQEATIIDPEHKSEYPNMVTEVLPVGIHIVNFATCELSAATGLVKVHYGVC